MATSALPFLTEEQYLKLERESELRHEYLHGEMFAMSGGTNEHSLVSIDLTTEFNIRLRGTPCRTHGSDMRIRVAATRFNAYPDISVVCGPPQYLDETRDCILNPILLGEVLSKSSRNYDRGEKFRQYQQIPTLRTYLLVEQSEMLVEIYVRTGPDSWNYSVIHGPDGILQIERPALEIPLSAIYQGVEFPPKDEYPPPS